MSKDRTAFTLALAAKLKELRGERTFQEVSDATLGAVSARMVDKYERGTEPRFATLLILASALGCKLGDIIPAAVLKASEKRKTGELIELLN